MLFPIFCHGIIFLSTRTLFFSLHVVLHLLLIHPCICVSMCPMSIMYEGVRSSFDMSSWSLVTADIVTLISIDLVVIWHGDGLEYVVCTVLILLS